MALKARAAESHEGNTLFLWALLNGHSPTGHFRKDKWKSEMQVMLEGLKTTLKISFLEGSRRICSNKHQNTSLWHKVQMKILSEKNWFCYSTVHSQGHYYVQSWCLLLQISNLPYRQLHKSEKNLENKSEECEPWNNCMARLAQRAIVLSELFVPYGHSPGP